MKAQKYSTTRTRSVLALSSLLLVVLLSLFGSSCSQKSNEEVTIYIVRHAEKAGNSTMQNIKDPHLSAEGYLRAKLLASILSNESINGLFSTDYLRTTKTLEPIAAEKSLAIALYKANEVTLLLDSLITVGAGKKYLISGHSNTILPIISYLNGALPQANINENEYNKLFKIIVGTDTTLVERSSY
jgi:phosphohistidine phosphatase SixA